MSDPAATPPTPTPPKIERRGGYRAANAQPGSNFKCGDWPKSPPFTISRKATGRYFLVGHLPTRDYRAELEECDTDAFPWTAYLGRTFGTGHYQIDGAKSANGTRPRSFLIVTQEMVDRALADARERAAAEPDDDAPGTNPPGDEETEDAMIATLERDLDRIERIKARLGIKDNPPTPPPGFLDFLQNPAIAQMVPHLMQAMQPKAAPAPEPSKWEALGRLYESLGISAETMAAQLEQELAAKRDAEAAAASLPR